MKPVVTDTIFDPELTDTIILERTVLVIPKHLYEENLEFSCTLVKTKVYIEKRAQRKKIDLVYVP